MVFIAEAHEYEAGLDKKLIRERHIRGLKCFDFYKGSLKMILFQHQFILQNTR